MLLYFHKWLQCARWKTANWIKFKGRSTRQNSRKSQLKVFLSISGLKIFENFKQKPFPVNFHFAVFNKNVFYYNHIPGYFMENSKKWFRNLGLADKHKKTPKSIRVRSFSGSHFLAFELNTEIYRVNLRIQSKCGKIRNRKTLNMDTFQTVQFYEIWSFWLALLIRKFHRIQQNFDALGYKVIATEGF